MIFYLPQRGLVTVNYSDSGVQRTRLAMISMLRVSEMTKDHGYRGQKWDWMYSNKNRGLTVESFDRNCNKMRKSNMPWLLLIVYFAIDNNNSIDWLPFVFVVHANWSVIPSNCSISDPNQISDWLKLGMFYRWVGQFKNFGINAKEATLCLNC